MRIFWKKLLNRRSIGGSAPNHHCLLRLRRPQIPATRTYCSFRRRTFLPLNVVYHSVARELFQDRGGQDLSAKAFNAKYGSSLKPNCFLFQKPAFSKKKKKKQNSRILKKKKKKKKKKKGHHRIWIWGVFLAQNSAISKKKVFTGHRVFLTHNQRFWPLTQKPNKVLTQNQPNKVFSGAFFVPNMAQDKSLRGAKVVQGGPKYLQGGQLPPHFPRLWYYFEA